MTDDENKNGTDGTEEKGTETPAKWRRKTPYEIYAKPSKLRIVDIVISAVVFIGLWVMFFIALAGVWDPYDRKFSYIACALLMLAPFIVEMIFGIKIGDFILTFYIAYALFAGVLCSGFAFYKIVPEFDKVAHSLFGYVGCLIGLLAVCKLSDYNRQNPLLVVIVCFAVSLACGACWEIMEFTADLLFNQTAQGVPVETVDGALVVDKLDTMLDLICNFCGAIVFIIHYVIHVTTKRNLLMGSIIRDFNKRG